MKVNAKVTINTSQVNAIKQMALVALEETADATKSDLIRSKTMPFDTGELQNRSTFVDKTNSARGIVSIISDTPYARRLYYHPEYKFKTDKNKFAGSQWFHPYIGGSKNKFCYNTFARKMRSKMQ